jgi:hypothetical protein
VVGLVDSGDEPPQPAIASATVAPAMTMPIVALRPLNARATLTVCAGGSRGLAVVLDGAVT